jgi:hypothetical protein
MAKWYEPDPVMGVMTYTLLDNGEVWHLDKRAYLMLGIGEDHTKPNSIESSPNRDLYIVARCNKKGEKIKLTLEMIHIDNKDMHPIEQYGPAFIKRNENGRLYKSQMFRSYTNSIKENTWERDYGINLKEICKTHLNTFAHSKVKGFMWLFTSHALPVGTRLRCNVKISAYADNMAVHLGSLADINIYKALLRQYSLATGGITNFSKSEAVLCGKWRSDPPQIGICTVKASKYLKIITGADPELALATIAKREARVYRQLDAWDTKLSSSPLERVMVAKIMGLSLVWYHIALAPGWEQALNRIEKRVQAFIWKKGIPKVAKNKGGLSVWYLVDKARAFLIMWVVKLVQSKTNTILETTIKAAVNHYAKTKGTEVPLWESRLDHSHDITATTSMKLLAMLQGAWSMVVRRIPTINNGDWIGYYDGSSTKQTCKDTLWEGRGRVIQTGDLPEDSVTTDWYSFD